MSDKMRNLVRVFGVLTIVVGLLLGFFLSRPTPLPSQIHSVQRNSDFDPFAGLEPKYGEFASAFVWANTAKDVAYIKRKIDAELSDKVVLRKAGLTGLIASLVANVLSPELWLIVLGAAMAMGYTPMILGAGILAGVYQHFLLDQTFYTGRDPERIGLSVVAGMLVAALCFAPRLVSWLRRKLPS